MKRDEPLITEDLPRVQSRTRKKLMKRLVGLKGVSESFDDIQIAYKTN